MDKLLVDAARKEYADNVFDCIRENYAKENHDYLQKQLNIAWEYMTDEMHEQLKERITNSGFTFPS